MSDDEMSVPALLQAETIATTGWIRLCEVCGENKVMAWHGWMHDLFVLRQENDQLRALLARSLPVMQSMSHTINEEYNHCNEDWQIDEIREQAKSLGVEVQECAKQSNAMLLAVSNLLHKG